MIPTIDHIPVAFHFVDGDGMVKATARRDESLLTSVFPDVVRVLSKRARPEHMWMWPEIDEEVDWTWPLGFIYDISQLFDQSIILNVRVRAGMSATPYSISRYRPSAPAIPRAEGVRIVSFQDSERREGVFPLTDQTTKELMSKSKCKRLVIQGVDVGDLDLTFDFLHKLFAANGCLNIVMV